jgi:hypothetical protein
VKAIAIVAVLSTSAAADHLVMKETESDNIHIANHQGAINRRADITITVDLSAGGKAKVIATGTRSEHNLFDNFSTDEDTKWTTTWTGTWTSDKGSRDLELAVAADHCSHTKKSTGQAPELLACNAPAMTARVTCKTETVTVEDFTGTAKPITAAAWSCDASAGLGETPSTWMLGKSMCLTRITGKGGTHYTKCP